ncbi:hypothetical protein H5410_003585 [Solanum commersonii]|uniref:Uncharacterized protein n=1 Tax=Solanum commersonii TaxID=4109 RepID=A0A9J6B5K2_SOLCO|nr:hypothetical protein H5410_003585 [Solanum commersonii]
MFVPSNTVATSNTSANEISDLNEWENCDAHLNFHNMDELYQNIGASISIRPNEHGSEYDQVYSFDQKVISTYAGDRDTKGHVSRNRKISKVNHQVDKPML